MRKALTAQLANLGNYTSTDEWVEDTLADIVGAEDYNVRWCVATKDPHANVYIFGPYATPEAAAKALESGALASQADTRGMVMPLVPAPKRRG